VRRLVQPRDVVDRDQHRSTLREDAKHLREPRSHGHRLGRYVPDLRPKKCDLQRAKLWDRNPTDRRELDAVEQVRKRKERKLQLRLARPRRQHAQPALASRRQACLPHRRLPDPRLPDQRQTARRPSVRQEARHTCKLALPAHEHRLGRSRFAHRLRIVDRLRRADKASADSRVRKKGAPGRERSSSASGC
jgi:hypothetical protein